MVLNHKEYAVFLTPTDAIDVKLFIRRNEVVKFSLNYRTEIDGRWYQVYRIDSYHGYLHEMKYWISPKPIRLPYIERQYSLGEVFRHSMNEIKNSFGRYRSLYEKAMR